MKIGWILSGNRRVAGARIQGWNMHELLVKRNYDSHIIFASEGFSTDFSLSREEIDALDNFDVIFVQKMLSGENLEYFLKHTSAKIVYICIDKISPLLVNYADHILTVSDNLFKQLPKEKTQIIFDGYEQDSSIVKNHSMNKSIKLMFLSNNIFDAFPQLDELPKNTSLTIIGPPLKRIEKYFGHKKPFSKTPFPFDYLEWCEETIVDDLLQADIALIPYPDDILEKEYIKNKSNNRLVFFMSLGLPTIASPLQEFEKIIVDGVNGYIARNKDDWIRYICQLRDDIDLRKKIGEAAKKSVNIYSKERQADMYEKILNMIS